MTHETQFTTVNPTHTPSQNYNISGTSTHPIDIALEKAGGRPQRLLRWPRRRLKTWCWWRMSLLKRQDRRPAPPFQQPTSCAWHAANPLARLADHSLPLRFACAWHHAENPHHPQQRTGCRAVSESWAKQHLRTLAVPYRLPAALPTVAPQADGPERARHRN